MTAGFCGAAANPVPLYTQYALVSNLCPECKTGDLDQELAGDGRWKISWYPVQCAVGNTPFVYSFQASSAYYIKLQISNHRWGRARGSAACMHSVSSAKHCALRTPDAWPRALRWKGTRT